MVVESSTSPSGESIIGPQSGICTRLSGAAAGFGEQSGLLRRQCRLPAPAGGYRFTDLSVDCRFGWRFRGETRQQTKPRPALTECAGGGPRLDETGASRP